MEERAMACFGSSYTGKNASDGMEDYEFSTMRKGEDRTPKQRMDDYEHSIMRKSDDHNPANDYDRGIFSRYSDKED